MQYNSFQRFTSSVLIFAILFSFTVQMPFFSILNRLFAADENYYNIVSLIVQEEIYPQIEASVNQYAKNIQKALENTKTVIIPVPGETHPYNIASINEKLYFDGYGAFVGSPDHSKLIGTVFIGNLALPVVENRGAFEKTVFPYVDFDDKLYIYDESEQLFKYNTDIYKTPQAEIWHGFISPNTGDEQQDIAQINGYFKKNNEYYTAQGIFSNQGVMDGLDDADLSDSYAPHVFYYDQIRESKAVQLVEYNMYNALHKYREELSYNHFSKEFAATLKGIYEKAQGNQLDLKEINDIFGFDVGDISSPGWDSPLIPDVQMRHIIKSLRRPFLQVFSSGIFWEMRAYVHNAGRYNGVSGAVNVDLIPTLITNIDEISAMAVRNVNNDLEEIIDPIMKQISRDIAIPTSIVRTNYKKDPSGKKWDEKEKKVETYTNYLYGTEAKNISEAMSCTIYRGSTEQGGTLVELNRAYNVQNSLPDSQTCRPNLTMGIWWGYTPLNLDMDAVTWPEGFTWKLKKSDYRNATHPLYDPQWGKQTGDSKKNPTPQNCLENNMILTKVDDESKISCSAVYQKLPEFNTVTFEELVMGQKLLTASVPTVHTIYLDGEVMAKFHVGDTGESEGDQVQYDYYFKSIKSHFEHKAPSTDILAPQVKNQVTTNMPIDKIRYIDIIAANSDYTRYNYPQIFDIELNDDNISLSTARASLKAHLDKKSKELNDLIKAKRVDLSALSGIQQKIYTKLKKDPYYEGPIIDLYKYFESMPEQEVTILGETKKVTYMDTLVFGMVWWDLDTVAGKYKFIFENYLSDQFQASGQYENVFLPRHKKQYEIAYLWAPGDAKHMYIQMDPEGAKWENPYTEVLQKVQDINNITFWSNRISDTQWGSGAVFRCAPPEGVPIWEWIPAVMCRLADMLPPKLILNTKGSKTPKMFVNNEVLLCDTCIEDTTPLENISRDDVNKNGIPDALEEMHKDGSLHFVSDAWQYLHNTSWILEVAVLDKDRKIIRADSQSQVTFQVTQIQDLKTQTQIRIDEETQHLVGQYINLRPVSMPLSYGKRQYSFFTAWKDAIITVQATVKLESTIPKKDQKSPSDAVVVSQSETITFKISGERLQLSSVVNATGENILGNNNVTRHISSVQASDKTNVFLREAWGLPGSSGAREKLTLTVSGADTTWTSVPLAYPISVSIRNENGEYIAENGRPVEKYSRTFSSLRNTMNLASLYTAGMYTINIVDANGSTIKKQVTVLPDTSPSTMKFDVKLSTNLVESGWVVTNHVVMVTDAFDNIIAGHPYTLEGNITGNAVTFENGTTTQEFQMYEWYKTFQLISTPTVGSSQVSFVLKQGQQTLKTSPKISITSLSNISFDVVFASGTEFRVGNKTYPFTIQVTNNWGTNFTSKAFVTTNSNYIRGQDGYINIVNNTWEGTFSTLTTAGKNIKIEFQVEWIKKPFYKTIDILPEAAIKTHISLTKWKLKATNVASDPLRETELSVELRDRYNNVVWNDNTTQINLEIRDEFKKVLQAKTYTQTAQSGIWTFRLHSTALPGVAFFKTSTTPDLTKNSISLWGTAPFKKEELNSISVLRKNEALTPLGSQLFIEYDEKNYQFIPQTKELLQGYFNGDNIEFRNLSPSTKTRIVNLFEKHTNYTVPGYGENVGKVDTYYFWNPQKSGQKYNGLYTALLWSNYGDITTPGNLANSIIFDKENSALGVTSLLSYANKKDEVLGVLPNGRIHISQNNSNSVLDIQWSVLVNSEWRFEIQLFDNIFWSPIFDTQVFLGKPNILVRCSGNDIAKCHPKDSDQPTIFATTQGWYRIVANEIVGWQLENTNQTPVLTINKNGKVTHSAVNLTYELSSSNKTGLQLFVMDQGKRVATLNIFFPDSAQIIPTRDTVIPSFPQGGMLLRLIGKDYSYAPKYLWSSTKGKLGWSVLYNDPFASSGSVSDPFGSQFEFGIERFESRAGIWWMENNKMFLSFAAGKTLWQATKDFQSFRMINIGDPVIHLKTYRKELSGADKKRKYDSSIGLIISQDEDNITYGVLDYNKDGNDDIAILKNGGYIQLLEGTGVFGDFLDRGNVIYMADISPKSDMHVGDFTWDGYGDIVVTNKKKELVIFSNQQKDFLRIRTNISVDGAIVKFLVQDMDEDGKDDIIILDEGGKLYVFYGTEKRGQFTKKILDEGLMVELNSEEKREWWAVYYDGLYQITYDDVLKNIADSQALLNAQKQNMGAKNGNTTGNNEVNEAIIDKMIFVPLAYTPHSKRWIPTTLAKPVSSTSSTGLYGANILGPSAVSQIPVTNPGNTTQQTTSISTTFLRSEYAQYDSMTISKKYTDKNGWGLRGGDIVDYRVRITNTSNSTRKDIAYAEKLPTLFTLSPNTKISLTLDGKTYTNNDVLLSPAVGADYTFVVDGYRQDGKEYPLVLGAGKSLTLSLELITQPFTFGTIRVGNFDSQDPLPDVLFRDSEENCGSGRTIYASQWWRDFKKWYGKLTCPLSSSQANVPGQLDHLGKPVDFKRLETDDAYRQAYTSYMYGQYFADRDGDGLPDSDDYAPGYNGETEKFLDRLATLNDRTDDILNHIDVILAGFSCGFGWGGCISTPLNWAPLAPGSDPTLFGMPIGDGLHVNEWLPVFSGLTWIGIGPLCVPTVWPVSPLWAWCTLPSAGWRLGTWDPTNVIRVFITPTLTWAIGMAVCFGGPAIVAWYANPPWLHPFVPGGNCVVAAMPLFWCKDDGSDGSVWEYSDDPDANFVNGNCSKGQKSPDAFLGSIGWEFVQYRNSWRESADFRQRLKDTFKTVADGNYNSMTLPDRPLINIGNGDNPDFEVNVDFWALADGNFSDVVDISMRRISAFPDFVMEWVTRQVEEIANKLTDFPTLYIILPDFQGVFDGWWGEHTQKQDDIFDAQAEESQQRESEINTQIANLKSQESSLCGTGKDANGARCLGVRSEILKLEATRAATTNKVVWWIKSAYEFISNIPLVDLEVQKVYIDIPWADQETIERAITDFEATKRQWEAEFERAQEQWRVWNYTCLETTNNGECKMIVDMQGLISSIDRNIEILESYKKIPGDVYRMIKMKDIRINQLMENIDSIFQLVWGRIADNGIRFEAWVDLFILIKAILKSWQLLVDVFIDFDAECHQCKNERYDLQYFIWKMISIALPKIPVIRFPKWPDIILDLHNIRAQITVEVPEFEFNFRPIVLPTLPNIHLPDAPTVTVHLPELPILPEVILPTLPDLPMIPLPELPNLPPPPKLPKLLWAIEMFLKILKIITKVMCILKTSPFVPEWRAGDQIAFITERQGYMGFDFIDISWPEFSYPWVDAIKVTTYVNLEMRIDFLTEMARNAAMPLNIFGNNIANMLDISIGDIDLSWVIPSDIDIDLWWTLNGYTPLKKDAKLIDLASWWSKNIASLQEAMEENMNIPLATNEFREYIAGQNISHPKIQGMWDQTLSYGFATERAFIKKLQDEHTEKFDTVQSILQEEKLKNLELLEKLQENFAPDAIATLTRASAFDNNTALDQYRNKAQTAAKNMFVDDGIRGELRAQADHILAQVNGQIDDFQESLLKTQEAIYTDISESGILAQVSNKQALLATWSTPKGSSSSGTSSPQSSKSCPIPGSTAGNQPSFAYKGIYALETVLGKKFSYYLFDYKDELDGKEIIKEFDADNDGDDDIIYMVGSTLYLKQNFDKKKPNKKLLTSAPLVIKSANNPILWGKKFISAVNGFVESVSDNSYINMSFSGKSGYNNYQIEFFPIVDKFDDIALKRANYIPKTAKRYIIDAFSDIDIATRNREDTQGSIGVFRNNIATLHSVQISWAEHIEMTTPALKDMNQELKNGNAIQLQTNTTLYAGSQGVTITYYKTRWNRKNNKNQSLFIQKRTNIKIQEPITIVWIQGNVYIEESNVESRLSGHELQQWVGRPILPGTVITSRTNNTQNAPKVVVQYYDKSETVIDFGKDAYYELYDLWIKQKTYNMRLSMSNDFYYAKIRAFRQTLFSTYSQSILLSPQKESDTTAPSIGNMPALRVPVYRKDTIDLTDFIFEDSGSENIEDIYFDFDLSKDSDGDGNTINDRDYALDGTGNKGASEFMIIKEWRKIFLNIGPFDTLVNKQIRMYVVDKNGNIWAKNVSFQVYSPIPSIRNVLDFKINGKINEPLKGEPVSIYRLRNNTLDRLQTTTNEYKVETIEWGNFLFNTKGKMGDRLTVNHTDPDTKKTNTLMYVDEATGQVDITQIGKSEYHLRIWVDISSNPETQSHGYPQISVYQDNTPIYFEYLATPNAGRVENVTSFAPIVNGTLENKIGVYYMHENAFEYSAESLPLGIERNAGDLYIYKNADDTKKPVVTLSKEGRIQISDPSITLQYAREWKYVVYEIKRNTALIGSVLIIPEENYIITGE